MYGTQTRESLMCQGQRGHGPASTIHHTLSVLHRWHFTIHSAAYYSCSMWLMFFKSSLFCFLYSKSICNRSLYSTLLCKVIVFQESGMLRSTLYLVKCPEVMDVNEHVVCFDNYNTRIWLHIHCSQFSGLTIYVTCFESDWIYSVSVL